jgi:molybdenum cofactor biosynthesis protein B
MGVEEHRSYAPDDLGFGVLTVSSSRAVADDRSGDAIEASLRREGHRLVERRLVEDDVPAIRASVEELLDHDEVDVVVVTGGTGLSPRDLTPEAVAPLLDRVVDGFGELFRSLSFQEVGSAAMLSRAVAGVVGGKAVFVLPGSPGAVTLGMERLILPEAGHLLGQARREG